MPRPARSDRFHLWLAIAVTSVFFLFSPSFHFHNLFQRSLSQANRLFMLNMQEKPEYDPRVETIVLNTRLGRDASAGQAPGFAKAVIQGPGLFGILIPASPEHRILTILIHVLAIPGTHTYLFVQPKGQRRSIVARWPYLRDRMFDLSRWVKPGEPALIGVSLEDPDRTATVQRFVVTEQADDRALPPVGLLVSFLCFLYWLGATLLTERRVTPMAMWLVTSLLVGVLIFGQKEPYSVLQSGGYWLFLLSILLIARQYLPATALEKPRAAWFSLILALSILLRWNYFAGAYGAPLIGDPIGWINLSKAFHWSGLFDNGVREPLYPWMGALTLHLFGPNEFQYRLLGLGCSVATVGLTYLFARRLSSQTWVPMAAAFFMARHDFALYSSVLAERTELYNLGAVAFFAFMSGGLRRTYRSVITFAALGAMLCLTWMWGAVGLGLYSGWRFLVHRSERKVILIGLLFVGVLLSPYLYAQVKTYRDPLIALNYHASYYKNLEHGVEKYDAQPHSWWQQFKTEGISQLIRRTAVGYASILLNPLASPPFNRVLLGFHFETVYSYFMVPFYLAGLWLTLRRRQYEALALMISFLNLAPHYINEIIQPRYIFCIAPIFAYFWAVGFVATIDLLKGLLQFWPGALRFPNRALGAPNP